MNGASPVDDHGAVSPESHPHPGPGSDGLSPEKPSRLLAVTSARCSPQLGTGPGSKVMSLIANVLARDMTFWTEGLGPPPDKVGS